MPFDPTLPQPGTLIDATPLRNQFNALKTLIDNVPPGPPGPPGPGLTMRGEWSGSTNYVAGDLVVYGYLVYVALAEASGTPPDFGGSWKLLTIVGPQGEVTLEQLGSAIAGTARNPESVTPLGLVVSDPPTQAEVQQIVDKLDALINALRRS